MTDDASAEGDPLAACTAVLATVDGGAAERIERFLRANDILCRIRPNAGVALQGAAAEGPPMWDVLVRPEVLPGDLGEGEAAPPAAQEPVRSDAPRDAPSAAEPVVLCELPWDDAWRLAERLIASGIPAAVMAGESGDRDRPMGDRQVPVGVRPSDLERARAFLE